jgi:large repetitive protein
MRLARALILAAALAAVVVPDALALRFTDAPCTEAGPGGIRTCPAGVVGTPYALKLEGSGGCGPDPNVPGSGLPYQFRVLHGALPPGLSLRKDGLLSGTPTKAGSWSFWVELSDEDPPSASWCIPKKSERLFSVQVGASPATVGTPYSLGVGASGEEPQTWSIASGKLPPGLTLDPSNGVIAGMPELPGSFPLKLSAIDGKGRTAVVELTIIVRPKLVFATTRLTVAQIRHRYRATVRTKGGVGPVTLKVLSGRFPIGIRLDVRSGVLTGKPRKVGVYRITLEAHDALRRTVKRTFVLTVRCSAHHARRHFHRQSRGVCQA